MNAPIRSDQLSAMTAAPTLPAFVHLRVRSAYSLLQGALPIPQLAKLAVANRFAAIALTDQNNLFGALEFSNKLADAGVQPIAGLTLTVDFRDTLEDPAHANLKGADAKTVISGDIALLAMSEEGYANLMKLGTEVFFDPALNEAPHIAVDRLEQHSAGLIALTGGADGPIARALIEDRRAVAEARLDRLVEIFPDRLYVEIQRHRMREERETEAALIQLAYAKDMPLVATNDCHFATPSDYEAHDALMCIAGGNYVVEDDRRQLSPEHCLKSADDMLALFADLPEAIANTVEIARRCHYRPLGRAPILPRFVSTGDGASAEELLKAEAEELARLACEGL